MRTLVLAAAALVLACGRGTLPGEPIARPVRPSVFPCIVSDQGPVSIETLPGATSDGSGWTAHVAGQAIAAPAPFQCSSLISPARTIGIEDPTGRRFWLELSVTDGGTDVTPAIADPIGAVTLTWIVRSSFARYQGVAVEDSRGLLLATNAGDLLLGPGDAGGLATARGPELPALYESTCGVMRDVAVTFTTGGGTVTLAPDAQHPLPLGAGSVTVWNLDAGDFVGPVRCTDVSSFVSTLAWRPPAS